MSSRSSQIELDFSYGYLDQDAPAVSSKRLAQFLLCLPLLALFIGIARLGEWFQSSKSGLLMASANIEERVSTPTNAHRSHVAFIGNKISRLTKMPEANALASIIVSEAKKADVDPIYVAAVIKYESMYRKSVVSKAGAVGLMQLMPSSAKGVADSLGLEWRGRSMLTDPSYNIRLGIAYLKYLEDMFGGNKRLALIAYNSGPNYLKRALDKGTRIPSSITNYAESILMTRGEWAADMQRQNQTASAMSRLS